MRYLSAIVFASLLLISCQQQEIIDEIDVPTKEDLAAGVDQSDNPQKTLIIDGVPYYVGIGYSPTLDQTFAPAFQYDNWTVVEDNPPVPLKVEVETIRTNQDLEDFVRKSSSTSVNFLFSFFGFGHKTKKTIEKTIKISRETVTVIAKVSVQRYKYLMEGDPVLDSRAQQLVDDGRVDFFLRRYGAMYVDVHTLGGVVYYIYSYNASGLSKETRSDFERNIKLNIEELFNVRSEGALSEHDKEVINNSVEKYTVVSNIPGYAPTLVEEESQLPGEIANIQKYLGDNPTLAASLEMTLRPYSAVYDFQALTDAYQNEAKCYADWEQWSDLEARMQYIYTNTKVADTRNKAQQALDAIAGQIANSRTCSNSVTPSGQEYIIIEQTYEEEARDTELAEALVPVYSYVNDRTVQFRLTPFPSPRKDWTIQPITFQWFASPFPGAVPLYEFRDSPETFYSTNPDRVANGLYHGFEYQGEVGYLFPAQVEGSIPLLRAYVGHGYYYHTVDRESFPDIRTVDDGEVEMVKVKDEDIEVVGYVLPYE